MKTLFTLILVIVAFKAEASETILDCRISKIAVAKAFGGSVALSGKASEVKLSVNGKFLNAKLGHYANYASDIPREIVTRYEVDDKEIVYLSKFHANEMVILSVLKERDKSGLRPGRVVLQRGAEEFIAAYIKCL